MEIQKINKEELFNRIKNIKVNCLTNYKVTSIPVEDVEECLLCAYEEEVRSRRHKFVSSPELTKAIGLVAEWWVDSSENRNIYSNKRPGLIICSEEFGNGKTTLMNAICRVLRTFVEWKVIPYGDVVNIASKDILNAYKADPEKYNRTLYATYLFLDNIGSESILNEFGVRVDVLGNLIERCYLKGKFVIATTSLATQEALVSRYGPQVMDMICEEFSVVTLSQEGFRKL